MHKALSISKEQLHKSISKAASSGQQDNQTGMQISLGASTSPQQRETLTVSLKKHYDFIIVCPFTEKNQNGK